MKEKKFVPSIWSPADLISLGKVSEGRRAVCCGATKCLSSTAASLSIAFSVLSPPSPAPVRLVVVLLSRLLSAAGSNVGFVGKIFSLTVPPIWPASAPAPPSPNAPPPIQVAPHLPSHSLFPLALLIIEIEAPCLLFAVASLPP